MKKSVNPLYVRKFCKITSPITRTGTLKRWKRLLLLNLVTLIYHMCLNWATWLLLLSRHWLCLLETLRLTNLRMDICMWLSLHLWNLASLGHSSSTFLTMLVSSLWPKVPLSHTMCQRRLLMSCMCVILRNQTTRLSLVSTRRNLKLQNSKWSSCERLLPLYGSNSKYRPTITISCSSSTMSREMLIMRFIIRVVNDNLINFDNNWLQINSNKLDWT